MIFFQFNSQTALIQLYDSDSEWDEGGVHRWSKEDKTLLHCAVEAIGINQWPVISKEWFNGRMGELELKTMWERSMGSMSSHPIHRNQLPKTSLTNMPFKRCNEEEAIELRKLFVTNSRSAEDMDLIYRAYLVGHEKLDKILRMNAPRRNEDLRISLSSIIVQMKDITRESLSACKLSVSRYIKKLPRSVLDIPMDKMISPLRSVHHTLSDHRCLRFCSTSLPVHEIIMRDIVYGDDFETMNDMESFDSSEVGVLRLTSPKEFVLPVML